MQGLLLGVAALACPVGMGVMMWVMAKGMRRDDSGARAQSAPTVDALREEHERLGEQIDRMESGERPLTEARS